jgi:hypothetical protein
MAQIATSEQWLQEKIDKLEQKIQKDEETIVMQMVLRLRD